MAKGRRTDRPKPVLPDLAEVFKNLIVVTDTPDESKPKPVKEHMDDFDFETVFEGKHTQEITEDLISELVKSHPGMKAEDIRSLREQGFRYSEERDSFVKPDSLEFFGGDDDDDDDEEGDFDLE